MIHFQKNKVVVSNNVILVPNHSFCVKYDFGDLGYTGEVTENIFLSGEKAQILMNMAIAVRPSFWDKVKMCWKYLFFKEKHNHNTVPFLIQA